MTSRTHSGSTYTSPTRRAAALAVAMGYLLTLFPAAYAAPATGSPQLPPALPHESAGREMEATSRAVISAESGGEASGVAEQSGGGISVVRGSRVNYEQYKDAADQFFADNPDTLTDANAIWALEHYIDLHRAEVLKSLIQTPTEE